MALKVLNGPKAALTEYFLRYKGVDGVLRGTSRLEQRVCVGIKALTGEIAALTEINRKNSGVNGVQPEK